MDFVVEAKSHLRKKFITALMPSMISQLGLEKSKKSVLIMFDDDVEALGSTVPFDGFNCYLIVMKSQSLAGIGSTLAHEMVHVKQLASGKLKKLPRGVTQWAGKKYKKSTPYLTQGWEVQAFSMQELIFRRALEA
jgi:hypothetical protein